MLGGLIPQMEEGQWNGDDQDADQLPHRRRWKWRSGTLHLALWIALAALPLLWLCPDGAR